MFWGSRSPLPPCLELRREGQAVSKSRCKEHHTDVQDAYGALCSSGKDTSPMGDPSSARNPWGLVGIAGLKIRLGLFIARAGLLIQMLVKHWAALHAKPTSILAGCSPKAHPLLPSSPFFLPCCLCCVGQQKELDQPMMPGFSSVVLCLLDRAAWSEIGLGVTQ